MELYELKAYPRSGTGKGVARKLRAEGKIPAVIYGPTQEPEPLSVDIKELEKALAVKEKLYKITIEDKKPKSLTVMIQDLHRDPMGEEFLHVDFFALDLKKTSIFRVPIRTVGESEGVKEGGILELIRRELNVRCLPTQIPKDIEIDISGLKIGDSFHISDLILEEGVEVVGEERLTILNISAPAVLVVEEEEVPEGEEVEGEEAAEGEEGEGKAAPEGEAKEEKKDKEEAKE